VAERGEVACGLVVAAHRVLSPLVLVTLAAAVNYLIGAGWPDLATLGEVESLGDIGVIAALLLWLATFGFGEETGWRGFALPALQKRHGMLHSALVIGVFWALWHLPSFFYRPQYMALGLGGFFAFAFGVISGSVLVAWIYNGSGGSVLVVAIWHGLFDLLTTAKATQGTITAIASTVVMVWAVAIVARELWGQYRGRKAASLPVSPAPGSPATPTR
jgi:membrane protease YdiL (CAAX protease family)